jgi:hypothetical protein
MAETRRAMKMTTLRVGKDLWALLEQEAALDGVSVSQYIREAALARAISSASERGETPYGVAAQANGNGAGRRDTPAAVARHEAADKRAQALALHAQSEQAKRVSAQRRSQSNALVDEGAARPAK